MRAADYIKTYFAPAIVTLILCLYYYSTLVNFHEQFQHVEKDLACSPRKCVLLNSNTTAEELQQLLLSQGYVKSDWDAQFVSEQLCSMLKENSLSSIDDLKKSKWGIPYALAQNAKVPSIVQRFLLRKEELGQGEDYDMALSIADNLKSDTCIKGAGKGVIEVNVQSPTAGILVRLTEYHLNENGKIEDKTLAWAKTDNDGKAIFRGLNEGMSYSVTPIQEGYEFGAAKGTKGALSESISWWGRLFHHHLSLKFHRTPSKIELLDNKTLQKIKDNSSLIVRTPSEFKMSLTTSFFLLILLWWGIIVTAQFLRRPIDSLIVGTLMFLTSMDVLVMYSLKNPLTESLYGDLMQWKTWITCSILVVYVLLVTRFDLIKLYQGKYHIGKINLYFDPLQEWLHHKYPRIPKGSFYALLAILLTSLLLTLGQEVGGMRVNLNLLGFPFQPSEMVKYLIVLFMAGFFCVNIDETIRYSERGNVSLWLAKTLHLSVLIASTLLLLMLYLLLGDMGPALVIMLSFITLYSFAKSASNKYDWNRKVTKFSENDLVQLGMVEMSLILTLFIGYISKVLWLLVGTWLLLWLIYFAVKAQRSKQLFESSILFIFVIAAFTFGGTLKHFPLDKISHAGERLSQRIAICTNTWGEFGINDSTHVIPAQNNQVAEGLWGLARGDVWGEGIGMGFPQYISAAHTDMILESIGEEIGWVGLMLILIAYSILLWRTLRVGYLSDHPFTLFLCVGIAVVTAVQFFVILLGSLGIIPLTGVTVPFLSYGKVSMILNILAFGLVLVISSHNKSGVVQSHISHYQTAKYILCFPFAALMFISALNLFRYQIAGKRDIMLRPLLVLGKNGSPSIQYDKRFSAATASVPMGRVLDRNGIVLAKNSQGTSSKNEREYPYGKHLFWMVGDYNKRLLFMESPLFYMAECRHLSTLRGIRKDSCDKNGHPIMVQLPSYERTVNRFMDIKDTVAPRRIPLYNYSPIVDGYAQPRDVQLTIDAELQKRIQNRIAEHVRQKYRGHRYRKIRISAVILDATDGSLLTSACYPLPDYETLRNLPERFTYNDFPRNFKAFTDMDLGLSYFTYPGSTAKTMSAMAAYMKLGEEASNKRIGGIDMDEAFVKSSNPYFEALVRDEYLYNQLREIYDQTGCRYKPEAEIVKWAWGQGSLEATPLAMARVAATVVNNGKMPVVKYLKDKEPQRIEIMASNGNAMSKLKTHMKHEAERHSSIGNPHVGGKTGTAEREIHGQKWNDCWYMCFYEHGSEKYAIALRIERLPQGKEAKDHASPIVRDIILPEMKQCHYVTE